MKTARQIALLLTILLSFLSVNASVPSADNLMKEAQQKAAKDGKNIFLMFSTTGCAWCKIFTRFLDADDIKPIFTKYFVFAHLNLGDEANSNPGAAGYEKKYGVAGGVPFHLILTPAGNPIVDSREKGSGGNIGYPSAPNEIDWFMLMLKKGAPTMTEPEAKTIEAKLRNFKR